MSTPPAMDYNPFNASALETPTWLNEGDQAWQLTAATLVGLQSVPGLMCLYAGIMKRKWAINSAFMCFYSFASTLIVWVLYAYRASFGDQMLPFVGVPNQAVAMDWMLQQATIPAAELSMQYNNATMVYFQFVFAAITTIILAGSLLGRMNFIAWMIFSPLWITLSYTVGAFSVWGGGFLYQYGLLDYSGGYVIHLSSGTAGLVAAWWVGPRLQRDMEENRPNNVLVCLVGAGILWLGWNGFNGGDPYAAIPDAGVAVLNTNLCTATSLIFWVLCDMIYFKKPSVIGAVQGMITGLVAITPAAGFVAGWGAILLGVGSGIIPWITMNILQRKVAIFRHVDDTLGVFHTHWVAAIVGGVGTGIWATAEGVAAFGSTVDGGSEEAPGGAVAHYGRQIGIQILGALFITGWNIVWTSIILVFIQYVLRIPLRMSEEALRVGDYNVHGEEPYIYLFSEEQHNRLLYADKEIVIVDEESGMPAGVIHGKEISAEADEQSSSEDSSRQNQTNSNGPHPTSGISGRKMDGDVRNANDMDLKAA